jgi:hypothetical protein
MRHQNILIRRSQKEAKKAESGGRIEAEKGLRRIKQNQ